MDRGGVEGFGPVGAFGGGQDRLAFLGGELEVGEPGLVEVSPEGGTAPLVDLVAAANEFGDVLDGYFVVGAGGLELAALALKGNELAAEVELLAAS